MRSFTGRGEDFQPPYQLQGIVVRSTVGSSFESRKGALGFIGDQRWILEGITATTHTGLSSKIGLQICSQLRMFVQFVYDSIEPHFR